MRDLKGCLAGMILITAVVLGTNAAAEAQEVEPNDACLAAQDNGGLLVPSSISGSLDAPSPDSDATTDVDFFRFTAMPGQLLRVSTSSFGYRIGLFSDQCGLLATSDFSFNEPRIDFSVPASGAFVVAVASLDDNGFSGNGFFNPGPYTLLFVAQPPTIGSISGRVVDAISGLPLMGAVLPFAQVELRRCLGGSCSDFLGSQTVDARGMFLFQRDTFNRPIEVGAFMLTASASDFETVSVQFSVEAGEDFDAGDIALAPPPIDFSEIQPCTSILPQGGTCEFSVNIRNNTAAPLSGQAHSIIDGGFGGARFEATAGRASERSVRRARVQIPALSRQTVRFSFDVPSFVPNGTFICAELLLGIDPAPLFNLTRTQNLFCLSKGQAGLRALGVEESREIFRLMRARPSRSTGPVPGP